MAKAVKKTSLTFLEDIDESEKCCADGIAKLDTVLKERGYDKSNGVANIVDIATEIFTLFCEDNKRCNNFVEHSQRMMRMFDNMVDKISDMESERDKNIMRYSILLHDIMKPINEMFHATLAASSVEAILKNTTNLSDDDIKQVSITVLMHSSKKYIDAISIDKYTRLLIDLDLLDKVGVITLLRCTTKIKKKNCSYVSESLTCLKERFERVKSSRKYLKYDVCKEEYNRRLSVVSELISNMTAEYLD